MRFAYYLVHHKTQDALILCSQGVDTPWTLTRII